MFAKSGPCAMYAQLMTQQVLEEEWSKDGDSEPSNTVKKL